MMRILSIDLETRSSRELAKCGVYAYCDSEDFEILLFAYAFDDDEVKIVDLARGEGIPGRVLGALIDPGVIKTAYNANFERTCLARLLRVPMPPEQWRCTMVHALSLGLPGSLEEAAGILKLPQQKMKEGKALIRYFTLLQNGGRGRNLPQHDMEKWQVFKEYCKRDVEVEREIRRKLERFPLPESEQRLWELDQRINDGGILIDRGLVGSAIKVHRDFQEKVYDEAFCLTGINNPNSHSQIKDWLREKGLEVKSLSKKNVEKLWIVQRTLRLGR
jgi:DNA polymerase